MKLKLLLIPVAAIALGGALIAQTGTSAQGPGPSAGTVLTSGLLQPKGLQLGPDGMLYVAESGSGGTTDFVLDGTTYKNGYTGRISMINPSGGARTTVAEGLPSNASEEGEAVGPADVAFIGSNLYYLQTHAGDVYGFADFETGIYRVEDDGDVTLVADLGAYNTANPVDSITSGAQVDVEPGGNPYAMDALNGVFYVTDGNHNRLLRVTTGGAITEVTEFPDHPVSTGLDFAGGTAYVAWLGQGPFMPEDGKVVTTNLSTGAITEIASGAAMLTDVEFGPGGQLYALQFNDTTAGDFPAFGPFSGSIRKVNADGSLTPVVTGLSFATFLEFDGETAYVSNFGVTNEGEIVRIPNFSSVQPPAQPTAAPTSAATQGPAPTAVPTSSGGVIGAPDTGDGSGLGGGTNVLLPLAMIAIAGAAITAVGARAATRRG